MVGRSSMITPRATDPVRLTRRSRSALVLLGLVLAGCTEVRKDSTALVGGNVLTPDNRVLQDAVIVVRQGRIVQVAPREGFELPRTADIVDVTGRWIIPGLIDGHAHVEPWALCRYLAAGVTTVRDVHGAQDSILDLR